MDRTDDIVRAIGVGLVVAISIAPPIFISILLLLDEFDSAVTNVIVNAVDSFGVTKSLIIFDTLMSISAGVICYKCI